MKLFTLLFSFYNLKWKAITIPQLINLPKHFLSTRIHLLWWSCTFVDFLNDNIWYEIWIIYISFNSFCNNEIEFQFESVHVQCAYLSSFNYQATKQWKNNWKVYWKSYWRFYVDLLDNWRQFKQLKNCPRHTHRTQTLAKCHSKSLKL